MPKMKTHSGTKKRFRKTANGKLRGRRANSSHMLEKKSPNGPADRGGVPRPQAGADPAGREEALMSRTTNAVARRRRRKKVLAQAKGYWGRKHSSYRLANEQVMRSGRYAYRDRRARKREFRRLWIVRINAAARREGMSYSELIHGLGKAGVDVNRKMLADIAVRDPEAFRRFAELAREATAT
jgi:large subunit ribosomal protein L20